MQKEKVQVLEFGKSNPRRSNLTSKERFQKLDDVFDISEEGKIYFKDDSISCLGTIMIGKSNLLYHRFIDDKTPIEDNGVNINIASWVDDIVYESLTHYYKVPYRRLLEFSFIQDNDNCYLPRQYWDIRHKGTEKLNPLEWKRRNSFGDSWYEKLKDILNHEHMIQLSKKIAEERKAYHIYPEQQDTFKAFRLCSFEHTKVIIIGQDPYYTKDTADGLAFSFKTGLPVANQKSLDVIFTEIERDVYDGFEINKNYNLEYLAKQGVLLLNSSLTVQKWKPSSHASIGWDRFISFVLQLLWLDKTPKFFIPMGNVAQAVMDDAMRKCERKIGFEGYNYHYVAKTRHPAYDVRLLNNFGKCEPSFPETFSGSEVFSRCNMYLKDKNRQQIEWMDL